MKEGKTNFARVLDYLRANGFVRNQKDLADRIGITPTSVSRNKHGGVARPDEETIAGLNAAFGHIINIAYLRGESNTMLVADLTPQEKLNTGVNSSAGSSAPGAPAAGFPSTLDMSSLVNAALAAKDEAIASLRREIAAKDNIIATLHEQLKERTALTQSIQQQTTSITDKYESLLQEHNNLLHRINVNIKNVNGGHLSIAAEPSPGYTKTPKEQEGN